MDSPRLLNSDLLHIDTKNNLTHPRTQLGNSSGSDPFLGGSLVHIRVGFVIPALIRSESGIMLP